MLGKHREKPRPDVGKLLQLSVVAKHPAPAPERLGVLFERSADRKRAGVVQKSFGFSPFCQSRKRAAGTFRGEATKKDVILSVGPDPNGVQRTIVRKLHLAF